MYVCVCGGGMDPPYPPEELLSVLLCVTMEGWDESPDGVQYRVRGDHCPLAGPHHTHQTMHLMTEGSGG